MTPSEKHTCMSSMTKCKESDVRSRYIQCTIHCQDDRGAILAIRVANKHCTIPLTMWIFLDVLSNDEIEIRVGGVSAFRVVGA